MVGPKKKLRHFLEMDDPRCSKTLEESSAESKLFQGQNPCGQICGEDSVMSEFSKHGDGSHSILDENGSKNNDQIDVNSVTVEIKNEEETRKANNEEIAMEGFENDGESFRDEGVGEENEMTKAASLKSDIEMELLVKCNKRANNVDGSEVEAALEVIEDEGNRVAMTEEALEKIDDATQIRLSDPARKIDGLSLFVEVFGSLDGIYQVEDGQFSNEDVLREVDSSKNMPCEGNETLTLHNCVDAAAEDSQTPDLMLTVTTEETSEMDNVVDEDVGNQKDNFVVGDLVWIKTKTDLWWPGVVSDPSNATKDAGSEKKGRLLVKYFGNANSVWCFPIHLKHFGLCFDEMVQQNNSRCFYGAVERAASEFGRRVKEEMTCSCFSKGSSVQASVCASNANSVAKQKIDDLFAYSVSQFEPANFLGQIKYLAQDGSLPGKIKLIVTQNCLSAFYHSLGHCQLPMHQLRTTEAKGGTQCGSTPEKEYSKRTVVLRGKSNSLEKCGGEADRRQSSSSTLTLKSMEDKKESCSVQVEIFAGCNATSSEISHSSPRNSRGTIDGSQVSGQTGNGRMRTRSGKGKWSRERRKSKYLSYPYIDPNKGTPTSGQNETGDPNNASDPGKESNNKNLLKMGPNKSSCRVDEVCKPEDANSSSADMLSELLLTAINCSCYKETRCSASIKRFLSCFRRFAFLNHEIAANRDNDDCLEFSNKDDSAQVPETQFQIEGINKSSEENPSSNGKPRRRKRKKEAVTSADTLFPCTIMDFTNGSLVQKLQQLSTVATQIEKVPKKRKKTKAISDIEATAQLPDKDAQNNNSSVQGLQVSGNSVSKTRRGWKKRKLEEIRTKNGCGLLDLHGKCVKFVELLKDVQKGGPNAQVAGPSLLTSIPQQNNKVAETELLSEIMIRQQEASLDHVESCSLVQNSQQLQGLNSEPNSAIPDLNGNVGESGPGGNHFTDLNSVLNNKPRRRRRRKSAAAVPDEAVKNVELSGVILLYFTSGVPLPSVESLLTTFGGYGTLKESETRYLADSTAQVFFVQSSDALRAFRGIQENNPFGQALANCRLVYHSAPRNSSIPDLNGNIAEAGSAVNNVTDAISLQNKDKPRRRRRRKNKAQSNEEISGAILLNFNSGVALPSVESLVATFAGYGAIKESETRFLNNSSAQVAFLQTSNALQAFQSLQESNPFGAALAGYRFVYHSAIAPPPPPPPPPPPHSHHCPH